MNTYKPTAAYTCSSLVLVIIGDKGIVHLTTRIGPVKKKYFLNIKLVFFLTHQFKHMFWVLKRTVSLSTQKSRLNETVLLSTQNICFG